MNIDELAEGIRRTLECGKCLLAVWRQGGQFQTAPGQITGISRDNSGAWRVLIEHWESRWWPLDDPAFEVEGVLMSGDNKHQIDMIVQMGPLALEPTEFVCGSITAADLAEALGLAGQPLPEFTGTPSDSPNPFYALWQEALDAPDDDHDGEM